MNKSKYTLGNAFYSVGGGIIIGLSGFIIIFVPPFYNIIASALFLVVAFASYIQTVNERIKKGQIKIEDVW